MDLRTTSEAMRTLADNIERVITGKPDAVHLSVVALFSGQHLLLDDVPGVGKTMLARALSRSIDGTFTRIQGTSDLLPTDITGTTVFDQAHSTFRFAPGPVFANVVLFDEINRSTPKTQSALLQVMDEGAVAADGDLHEVPQPFFVLATRNPAEHHGTFPLAEGAIDRFGLSMAIGYATAADERQVVAAQLAHHPIDDLEAVVDQHAVVAHQEAVRTVHVEASVLEYAVAIVRATREHADVALGASPRGSISLVRGAQAAALLRGRDYVLPDDVKVLAGSALAHRMLLSSGRAASTQEGEGIVTEVLRTVRAPVSR